VDQLEDQNRRSLASFHEIKHILFMLTLAVAIVVAMAGWTYALGWVALKLIQLL
jgi:hypothetical protein